MAAPTTSWCVSAAPFGYNNLVSDMRGSGHHARNRMPGRLRCHSLGAIAGRAGYVVRWPARVRAGAGAYWRRVAVGISGLFAETHPVPEKPLSDGLNSVTRWQRMESLLATLV